MAILEMLGQVPHPISTLIVPILAGVKLIAGVMGTKGGALRDGFS